MDLKMISSVVFVLCFIAPTISLPVDETNSRGLTVASSTDSLPRLLRKRYINTSSSFGEFTHRGIGKIRTKRSAEEECEQLQLCRLHARSSSSFLAAFELYFVNKENARLWNHRARSPEECSRRFNCDE